MTNATDCLVVGGPANGRMTCLNRNAQGFPHLVAYATIDSPDTQVTYMPKRWWHPELERWFWIATREDDEVSDFDIILTIAENDFQPAWDLASTPAPEPPEEVA